MRLIKGISSTLAVVALVAAGQAAAQQRQAAAQQQRKPNIVILATGGTIAGAAASGTQAGYSSGAVTIDAMLKAVPGATDLANIKGEQIANIGSQDMSFEVLLKVAKRINELLPSPDVDGIVITHGTDTLEETAFFLNLVVKSDEPVVLVGSMRPSTAVSADGPLNLYNAIGVAVDPAAKGRGVLVVMNDWIHAAHSLTKTSTTALQTFLSPVRGLAGIAAYGKNDWYNTPTWKHTTGSEFDISRVIYSIDDLETTKEKGLVRQRTRLVPEIVTVKDPEEGLEEISPDIVGLRLRYYDGSDWLDTWDSTTSRTLPKAVEMTVYVKPY